MFSEEVLGLGGGVARTAENALSEVVGEGIFAIGGQVGVICDDVLVADVAVGECAPGKALSADDLHNVYCLTKPLPILLLAHALESAGCGADDRLDEVVSLPSWCPRELTFRRLASHDGGLREPSAAAWRMTAPDKRVGLLESVKQEPGPAYSEMLGGLIAEHAIEQMVGCSASQYCMEELLEQLGLADDLIVDAELGLLAGGRVRPPVSGLPLDALPMLSELLPEQISEIRLAFGALATMRGVALFFAAVGRVISGQPMPGLPSPGFLDDLLSDDRPLRYDPVLQRMAKWSGGLMVQLDQQGISRVAGDSSVGHAGGLANSAALYDPTRRASVAVFLNGVGSGFYDQALPRQQILDAVLDEIPAI